VNLLVQFEFQHPTAQQVTDKLCSLGSKCSDAAREKVRKVAELAIPSAERDARTNPPNTPELVARTMNDEIGRINYTLSKVKKYKIDEKPTEEELLAYTKAYITSVLKPGP